MNSSRERGGHTMCLVRNLGLIILFITTVFLADHYSYADSGDLVQHYFKKAPTLRADNRPWKIQSKLVTNPSETHRLVTTNLCKSSGEAQLSKLAATSKHEESFVLIPDLCFWIEVGYSETSKSVSLDTVVIEKLLVHHKTLILYHIHVGKPDSVKAYFPAYSDLIGLVILNAATINDETTKIVHKAVTGAGIIEYSLVIGKEVRDLVSKYERSGLGKFVAQNMAYEYMRESHQTNYYMSVRNCSAESKDNPKRLSICFPMRADDFLLKFEPSNPSDVFVSPE